jgi:hypothetical protein
VQRVACGRNGHQLGMRRRVPKFFYLVTRFGQYTIVGNNDGANRNFVVFERFFGQLERLVHVIAVQSVLNVVHTSYAAFVVKRVSATPLQPIFAALVKVFHLKHCAFFITLSWCAAFNVHGQETWSLQKCIAYAQEHNLTIKQAQVNSELSEASYMQSKLGLLPNLNGSANYGVNKGKNIDPTSNQFTNQTIQSGQASLSSSVVLFGGFSRINEMRASHFDYMSARYATQQSVNDISLAVANAYLQVVYAKELLQRSIENLGIAQTQQKRMQALVNAGSAAEGQLFEIDALVASEELNLCSSSWTWRNRLRWSNRQWTCQVTRRKLLPLKRYSTHRLNRTPACSARNTG